MRFGMHWQPQMALSTVSQDSLSLASPQKTNPLPERPVLWLSSFRVS
jgi:hypothetical protein